METRKETTYALESGLINMIQYVISLCCAILFGLGFIPYYYDDVAKYLIAALVVNFLISLIRFRILNVFIQIFLIGLSVLSFIPLAGYLFRILGLIFSIVDMSTFKNVEIYKKVKVFTIKDTFDKKESKKKKDKVVDVDFKEK